MRTNSVRDCHVDYLLKKVHIPAFEMVRGQPSSSTSTTLTAAFSIGSSQYVSVPGTRMGGFRILATTSLIDHIWRVPNDLDNGMPVYFRTHWTTSRIGTTVSATWSVWIATITSGTALTTSPIVALNQTIPAAQYNSADTQYTLNVTLAGKFAPLASGLQAYQTMPDNTEFLHVAMQPTSTTGISFVPHEIYLLGLDVEYTPRMTFGDGSNREARRMQSNLGFSEFRDENRY